MPTVDINSPRQLPSSGGSNGAFGTGLPMPVILAVVGGGIGLVVFLTRKSGANKQTDTNASNGTLLPNTAIMLGSLQQMVLETEGKITTGNADLSSQLTGVGENLGAQIDTQSGQIANSFSNLSTVLGTSAAALQGQQDALASAISTLGTQNSSLATSLGTVLTGLKGVSSGVNSVIQQQNTQSALLNSIGNWISVPKTAAEGWQHLDTKTRSIYLQYNGGDTNKAMNKYWSDVQLAIANYVPA